MHNEFKKGIHMYVRFSFAPPDLDTSTKVSLTELLQHREEKEEEYSGPKRWLAYYDAYAASVFYYEENTGEKTWEEPEKWEWGDEADSPQMNMSVGQDPYAYEHLDDDFDEYVANTNCFCTFLVTLLNQYV